MPWISSNFQAKFIYFPEEVLEAATADAGRCSDGTFFFLCFFSNVEGRDEFREKKTHQNNQKKKCLHFSWKNLGKMTSCLDKWLN